jgi:DNA-binding NarL/FixJ family response regulator
VARKATLSVAPSDGHAQTTAAYEAVTVRKAMSRNNPDLTLRELDILVFLRLGKSNREIAAELHLAENTVKRHLSSIFMKLGVSNRTEAAIVALGIFPPLAG